MAGRTLPSGMIQEKAPVLLQRKIARNHYWVRLKSPRAAKRARPGQFIHVLCPSAKAEPAPFLRRPFSLLDADPKKGTLDFVYKVVGMGTTALTHVLAGSKIDFLGPLGRPFAVPPGTKTAYLVGGGVGIPPLYMLAKQLARGRRSVTAFLGAKTKGWVIGAAQFSKLGVSVQIATDDGTLGHRGTVVGLLRQALRPADGDRQSTQLYICGPTPMMRAAAALARERRVSAQVSLEERMGCGMGCCWGCTVEMADEPAGSHARFQRVCTEGPVFPAEKIAWP